jgi:RHS repeat-associated protein
VTTDSSGNVVSRRDFRPYGEEIYRAGQGSDKIRQKFTSYERDNETNLDYAKARMFGSGLGRFTSPDPYNPLLLLNNDFDDGSTLEATQFIVQPQYWNRYSYTINNPSKLVDKDGEHPGAILAALAREVVRIAIRAGVGAAAGAAIEAGRQLWNDGRITSPEAVKASAVDGAIFGAFIGATGPIGVALKSPILTAIGAGSVGSVTGGYAKREMLGQTTTTGDVITDALAGGIGGGAGAAIGRLTAPKYNYPTNGFQRYVSDETIYRVVNRTANTLYVPRSITNNLFDSQMGFRNLTYGSSFPATLVRGGTKSQIRSTNNSEKSGSKDGDVKVNSGCVPRPDGKGLICGPTIID